MGWNYDCWGGSGNNYICVDLTGVASGIANDIGNNPAFSTGYIYQWITSNYNLGKLNDYIITSYSNTSGIISPCIGVNESAILAQIFLVNYYQSSANSALQGALSSLWLKIADGDGSVTRLSPNEIGKTYLNMKKSAIEELNEMVALYKINHASPAVINMGGPREFFYGGFDQGGVNNPRFGWGNSYL